MIQSIRKSLRSQRGQGMTEYIIIVALIAIAAIGVYSFFGETVRHQTAGMAKEMSGQSASSEQSAAKTSADSAATKAGTKANLGTYGNQQ
jgi:Flp pilus assembly pilin Flp